MAFYHDFTSNWLLWRTRALSQCATLIGGCVLCGRVSAAANQPEQLSPRLCLDCSAHMPNHIRHAVHRCTQCAHLMDTPDTHCWACTTEPPAFTHTIVFSDYAFNMQHMLLEYKFHRVLHYAPALADCLTLALIQYAKQHQPDIITTIPQTEAHTRTRGFSPLGLIVQHIDLFRIWPQHKPANRPRLDTALVSRVHHERLQIHAKHDQRRTLVKNAFIVNTPDHIKGAHIVLIDDIITTGATSDELARTLKRAGARQVDVVCIARTRRTPLRQIK